MADVEALLSALSAKSEFLHVLMFGNLQEGRVLLLATLSNPPVGAQRDLRSLGRPIAFVQANIHGGEVEGKQAVQNLMRRPTLRDLAPLLDG